MPVEVHNQVYSMQKQLDLIARQVDRSMKQPLANGRMIRDLALEIVRGCPQHGVMCKHCEIGRIFNWVKSNVEYRGDPADYDLFMTARRTIESGGSDCDDHTILVCSLLSSLGHRCGAKIVSPNGADWHIYPLVATKDSLTGRPITVALDTTQPESYPGWEPAEIHRKFAYIAAFKDGRATYKKVSG